MKELITDIVKRLVTQPNEVYVTEDLPTEDGITAYHVYVDLNDVGRAVGKEGRTAKAIRTICRNAARNNQGKVSILFSSFQSSLEDNITN